MDSSGVPVGLVKALTEQMARANGESPDSIALMMNIVEQMDLSELLSRSSNSGTPGPGNGGTSYPGTGWDPLQRSSARSKWVNVHKGDDSVPRLFLTDPAAFKPSVPRPPGPDAWEAPWGIAESDCDMSTVPTPLPMGYFAWVCARTCSYY